MRTLLFCTALLICASATAQSKKELQDEIAKLKAEVEQLKKPKEVVVNMNDPHQKASYGLGVLMANSVKTQGADSLNLDAMAAGIGDVLGQRTLKMDQTECMAVVQPYMQQAMVAKSAKAKDAGLAYLEENKKKEGVTTTASGLQYKVLTAGSGKQPTSPSDRVTVHYTGQTTDGNIFDSSVKRGQPATFALNEVIGGWTEAIMMMKEGDKWMLYIPYTIGYGERGNGPSIPPYSTLIFEVELIKVN